MIVRNARYRIVLSAFAALGLFLPAGATELQLRTNGRIIVNNGGHVIVNGEMILGDATTPSNDSGGSLEMNSGAKLSIAGDAWLREGYLTTGTGSPVAGTGAFTAGTIILSGDGSGASDEIFTDAAQDLFNLTIGNDGDATYPWGGTQGTKLANNALDINGAVRITGGTFNAGALTHTVAGNWTYTGGTFTPSTGTIQFDGLTSVTVDAGGTGASQAFNHVEINKTDAGAGNDNVTFQTTNGRVGGNLTLTDGELILENAATRLLEVGGNWERAAAAAFTPNDATVSFAGSAAQTVNNTSSLAETFWHLTINNSAGSPSDTVAVLTGGGDDDGIDLTVNGTLDVTDGQLEINRKSGPATPTIDVAGNVIIRAAGILDLDDGAIDFRTAGNWDRLTSGTFQPGSASTVTFDASVAQTINDTNSLAETFANLTINNGAGSPSDTVAVMTGSGNDDGIDLTVTGTLTVTDGQFEVNLKSGAAAPTLDWAVVSIAAAGILDVDDGTMTAQVSGNWTNGGELQAGTASTVKFDGTADQTVDTGGTGSTKSFYHVEFANAGTSPTNDVVLSTNGLAALGNLLISAGDLEAAGLAVNVAGNWTNNGSADGGFVHGGAGTTTLNGSGAQTLGGSRSTTFYNLTVNNSSSSTVSIDTDPIVANATAIDRGTVSLNAASAARTFTANGDVTVGKSGSFTAGTPELATLKVPSTSSGVAKIVVANRKSVEINPAGTLQITGVSGGNKGTLTTSAAANGFRLAVKGELNATNYEISNLGNRTVTTGTTTAGGETSGAYTVTVDEDLSASALGGHFLIIDAGGNAAGSPYAVTNVNWNGTDTILTIGKSLSATTGSNAVRVVDPAGVEIWRGATLVALDNGTLTSATGAEHRGPLLNFAPTPTEANWPEGGDRDKIPATITGVTFTGEFPTASAPENDTNLVGDANVRASYRAPVVHFAGFSGNLTTVAGAGNGTQAGGERNELDFHDRIQWDRTTDEGIGVAKIDSTYYNSVQAALDWARDSATGDTTITAASGSPVMENLTFNDNVATAYNVILERFVFAPRSGLAVTDTGNDGGANKTVTLRNCVVASGGIQGFDGSNQIQVQNCTIYQYTASYSDEYSGTSLDGGTWVQTKSPVGSSVTVGEDAWPSSETVRRIALVQGSSTDGPALESVQNPFSTVSGTAFTFETRFKYDAVAPNPLEIRTFAGGSVSGTAVLRISADAAGGIDIWVGGTQKRNGSSDETASAHTVKLYFDGTDQYTIWFDGSVIAGAVTLASVADFVSLGNTATLASGDWADLDIDYIRVTPIPKVTQASLSRSVQEIGDSGTTALSGTNLNLRRADATARPGDSRPVFGNTSRFDYHLNPYPFPGQSTPLANDGSVPTWYPIDRVSDGSGYTTEFDENTGVSGAHRPFDAPGTYAGSEPGTWDIGADEYRTNNGFDLSPKFIWGGSGDEDGTGPIKSFIFVGGRDGSSDDEASDGKVYAYFVSAGGGSDPQQDNTLRLFSVNKTGDGISANSEVTGPSNRLKAPGQVIFLTYLTVSVSDIRIYCVIDRDNDGKGDAMWAVQDTGNNSGTIFREATGAPASFNFLSGGGNGAAAGENNWGTAGTGDDFDNTPSTTQGLRWYGPGRIGINLVAIQIPGASSGSPRRLWFVVENDGKKSNGEVVPGTLHTNVLYCVDADDGATLWISDNVEWHWKSFPSIIPSPIVAGGVMYGGLAAGGAGGIDVCKMTGIMDTGSPNAEPTPTATLAIPAAGGYAAPDGHALDVSNLYQGPSNTKFYFATGDTSRIYRYDSSLNADTTWSNDSGVDGASVRLDPTASNPASTNMSVQTIWGGYFHYVSAGNKLYRIRDADGRKKSADSVGTASPEYVDSSDWPLSLRGPLSTYFISTNSPSVGGWLNYFGTEAGECYAVQDNGWDDGQAGYDGATGVLPGWPYIVPGQRIVDVRSLLGTIYFATDGGQIYGFSKQ